MKKTFLTKIICLGLLFGGCGNEDPQNDQLQKKPKESSAFATQQTAHSSASEEAQVVVPELNIKLTPFVPVFDGAPNATTLLKNRINSAVAKAGYGGEGGNPRFIIGPNVSLISQDVTSTAPTKYANVYELNFMVTDVVTETVFASYSVQAKGVAVSPQKAFISALSNVDMQGSAFMNFLSEAQTKAIKFFEENCSKMMAEAEAEAQTRNFEEAYALLSSVPADAEKCFMEVQEKKMEYFQMSLNVNCAELLSKMRAELGKFNDPSASGFNPEAMTYYSMIDNQSDCYEDAQKEYKAYVAKLDPKAKQDWEMEMSRYADELEMTKQDRTVKRDSLKYAMDHEAKMAEITAKAGAEGNQKLLAKYKHDESPWLIRLFSSGAKLWKGEMNTD